MPVVYIAATFRKILPPSVSLLFAPSLPWRGQGGGGAWRERARRLRPPFSTFSSPHCTISLLGSSPLSRIWAELRSPRAGHRPPPTAQVLSPRADLLLLWGKSLIAWTIPGRSGISSSPSPSHATQLRCLPIGTLILSGARTQIRFFSCWW